MPLNNEFNLDSAMVYDALETSKHITMLCIFLRKLGLKLGKK
jgi:hypothetical protein